MDGWMDACMHACMYVFIIYIYIYVCIKCVYIYIYLYVCMYVLHINVYTYKCIYIHVYIYIHIYVYDVYNLRCISATKGRLYIGLRSFIDLKLSLEFFNERLWSQEKAERSAEPSPRLRSVTQPVAGRAAAPGEISKAFWANYNSQTWNKVRYIGIHIIISPILG